MRLRRALLDDLILINYNRPENWEVDMMRRLAIGSAGMFGLLNGADSYAIQKDSAKPLEGVALETAEKMTREMGVQRKINFFHTSNREEYSLGDRLSLFPPAVFLNSDNHNPFVVTHELAKIKQNHNTINNGALSLVAGAVCAIGVRFLSLGVAGIGLAGVYYMKYCEQREADSIAVQRCSPREVAGMVHLIVKNSFEKNMDFELLPKKTFYTILKHDFLRFINLELWIPKQRLLYLEEGYLKKKDHPPITFQHLTISNETSSAIREMVSKDERKLDLTGIESIQIDPSKAEDNIAFNLPFTPNPLYLDVEKKRVDAWVKNQSESAILDLVENALKTPPTLQFEIYWQVPLPEWEIKREILRRVQKEFSNDVYDLVKTRIKYKSEGVYVVKIPIRR